jgi:Bacterial dnaA protein helix-turn-helix
MTYLETLHAARKERMLRLDPKPLIRVIKQLPQPPPPEPVVIIHKQKEEFPKEWLGRTADEIWRETDTFRFLGNEDGEMMAREALDPIIKAVAEAYGLFQSDIKSSRRDLPTIQARQVSYVLCRLLTLRSLPSIARAHCKSGDHSTISHGLTKLVWLSAELELAHTHADPLNAWVATAVRLHPPVTGTPRQNDAGPV